VTGLDVLDALPERGWGVVRAPLLLVLILEGAGLIRAQVTPTRDVFQARLTGAGRRYRRERFTP
jgi:hypothetical protein